MSVLARVGLRLVFWLSVGLAVIAVGVACLGTVLAREGRVQVGRRRAERHHRAAARAGVGVGDPRVPVMAGASRTSGRRTDCC